MNTHPTPLEREKADNDGRIKGLVEGIATDGFTRLPVAEREDLRTQLTYMRALSSVLDRRIVRARDGGQ